MLQDVVHVQHSASEYCKTMSTCNIAPPNIARRAPRATKHPRMLQDDVHVQHSASECCKTRSTCNIAPPNVARRCPRAIYRPYYKRFISRLKYITTSL